MRHGWGLLLGIVFGVGCASAAAETGTAVIQPTTEGSSVSGTATLTDTPEGLEVDAFVAGVAPGSHGIHIHEYGDCKDAGKAAGGHFNPDGVQHGFLPTDGAENAHPGDMGNIDIGAEGTGRLSVLLPEVALSEAYYSVGGRAIILHEQPDDFGQPTGNAGGRVGCGTIIITGS